MREELQGQLRVEPAGRDDPGYRAVTAAGDPLRTGSRSARAPVAPVVVGSSHAACGARLRRVIGNPGVVDRTIARGWTIDRGSAPSTGSNRTTAGKTAAGVRGPWSLRLECEVGKASAADRDGCVPETSPVLVLVTAAETVPVSGSAGGGSPATPQLPSLPEAEPLTKRSGPDGGEGPNRPHTNDCGAGLRMELRCGGLRPQIRPHSRLSDWKNTTVQHHSRPKQPDPY
jgi:hypothetical protein